MNNIKNIGLIAHDNRKQDLIEWTLYNWKELVHHNLVCTGTTGTLVEEKLSEKCKVEGVNPPRILKLNSGPLGGDQQMGSKIVQGEIDMTIFFWDPMEPQPHDVDVKALLRICVLYNIPCASNRSTADYLISSTLFHEEYKPILKDYSGYINRDLKKKIGEDE